MKNSRFANSILSRVSLLCQINFDKGGTHLIEKSNIKYFLVLTNVAQTKNTFVRRIYNE